MPIGSNGATPEMLEDIITSHRNPKLVAAAERLKAGTPAPRPSGPDPSLRGWSLFFDENGLECAAPPKATVESRMETWPKRLEGASLPRELPSLDDLNKAQRGIYLNLFKERKNAILHGRPGRGKSVVALMALRDLHLADFVLWAVSYSQFTRMCKPTWAKEYGETEERVLTRLASWPYLLIDDVGYGDSGFIPTDHDKKMTLELLAEREAERRVTWITTNHSIEDLSQYGEAAISRLRSRATEINFNGLKNYRLIEQSPELPPPGLMSGT